MEDRATSAYGEDIAARGSPDAAEALPAAGRHVARGPVVVNDAHVAHAKGG